MRPLSEYRVLLFDCDGVVIDSNRLKTDAFREVLAEHGPELVEQFVEYHRQNGGVSRYAKMRHFFTHMAKVPDAQVRADAAVAAFSAESRRRMVDAPLVPGVESVLRSASVPAYIVSGADQAELRHVFATRGMANLFEDILGSPTPKDETMRRLVDAGKVPEPAVFFGDARKDMEVAEEAGADFVFVCGVSDWADGEAICAGRGHTVIRDFRTLA